MQAGSGDLYSIRVASSLPGRYSGTRTRSERLRRAYPLRDLLDAGLLVAGASDSNVLPAEVMLGIHSAVNNPDASQRLSVDEAMRLYTLNAARMEFDDDQRGSLEIGKAGDLIVLDANPNEVDTERIRDINVIMTIVSGKVIYENTEKKSEGA